VFNHNRKSYSTWGINEPVIVPLSSFRQVSLDFDEQTHADIFKIQLNPNIWFRNRFQPIFCNFWWYELMCCLSLTILFNRAFEGCVSLCRGLCLATTYHFEIGDFLTLLLMKYWELILSRQVSENVRAIVLNYSYFHMASMGLTHYESRCDLSPWLNFIRRRSHSIGMDRGVTE